MSYQQYLKLIIKTNMGNFMITWFLSFSLYDYFTEIFKREFSRFIQTIW